MLCAAPHTEHRAWKAGGRIGSAASRGTWAVLVTLVLGMLVVFASPARAETFTVINTNDSGPGSLRQAITDANAAPGADEISFSDGLAGRTVELASVGNPGVFPGPSALVVTSEISIQGPAGSEGVTIARAGGAETPEMRLFYVAPGGDLTLGNLTLAGGLARGGDGGDSGWAEPNEGGDISGGASGGGGGAGMGGAIFNEGNLTVEGGTLSGNTARGGDGGASLREERGGGGGGGLATDGADGGVPGSTLAISDAGQGGDGGGPNGGEGAFRDIDFTGSFPGENGLEGGGGGGGVSRINLSNPLSLIHVGGSGGFGGGAGGGRFGTNSLVGVGGFGGGGAVGPGGFGGGAGDRFRGGGGSGMGGAIFNRGGDVVLTNSTLSGNAAVGGISPPGTFAENNGAGLGGGIFSVDGAVSVTSATLTDNAGGGIHAHQRPEGERSGSSILDLRNALLANNPGGADCANQGGGATTGESNLIEANGGCGGLQSTVEPRLGPLADNGGPTKTHALPEGSSAIDQGGSFGLAADQRGQTRPLDLPGVPNANAPGRDGSDIGAFEYAPDTAPPTVTATVSPGPNQSGWNNSDATVTISATDNRGGSGIEQVSYSASGAQQVAERNVPGASAELVVSAEGETVVTYWATDKDGNVSPQRQVTVNLDKSAPDTTVDSGPSGPTSEPSPAFGFSASEPDVTFECALDGGAYTACSSPQGYPGLPDGQHTFSVRATDRAGNTDPTPATGSFTVDTGAPEATITSGPQGTTNARSASFSFTSEPNTTFECSLDGSAFEACSSPRDYDALTDGDHTFEVRATDAAGNADPTPASRAWKVDTLGPTVGGMSPRNALLIRDRTPTIRATVKDNPTNLQKDNVKLYVNGKPISPTKWRYSTTTGALVYDSPKLSKGKKTVKIVATDAAGNAVTKSWYFRVR